MRKKGLLWSATAGLAVLVLAGAGVVMAVTPTTDYHEAAADYDKALAEAKANGVPLSLDDVLRPPVPEAQNAAADYQSLITDWEKLHINLELLNHEVRGDPARTKQANQELAKADGLIARAEKAARKPYCQFDRDWEDGMNVTFPEFAGMKSLVRAFCTRAILKAESGSMAGAIEDVRTAELITRHSGADPVIIAMMVQAACEALVNDAATKVAAEMTSEADFQALKSALTDGRQPIHILDYMAVEVIWGQEVSEAAADPKQLSSFTGMTGDEHRTDPRKEIARRSASREVVKKAYTARLLQFWNEVYSVEDKQDNRLVSERLNAAQRRLETKEGMSYDALDIVLPIFSHAGAVVIQREAERSVLLSSLEVLAYQARTGKLPATLAEAKAEYQDPFADAPLAYKADKGKFRIWSIGSDNIPDDKEEPAQTGEPGDIGTTFYIRSR